ncbi:hypothetical protein [Loktanella sp. 3ANDIMAR09]|uniref:hypothetical protein n=1 Tax=Loktanella sp. 3ANDIMAR09 TaxID=1225657 RepID=UPI0006FDC750|nr:hypothetical protein [Loktanella sp. 3ANDIMAR09]
MMPDKVVTLKNRVVQPVLPQAADVWHAQINQRLAAIERMLRRLEWQIWALCCGAMAVLGLHLAQFLQVH